MVTRLKEIMQEKGITSVALAQMMNVSKVTISSLINGKTQSLDTISNAATALGVPMWQPFASPNEIIPASGNGHAIKCPKCGQEFEVELKPKGYNGE